MALALVMAVLLAPGMAVFWAVVRAVGHAGIEPYGLYRDHREEP